MSINNVIQVGRLVADPKLTTGTDPSKNRCSFKLAVKDVYAKEERADFFWCVAWGKNADNIAKSCGKGKEVTIEGRLRSNLVTKEDGTKRDYVEIVVSSIHFGADAKSHGKTETTEQTAAPAQPQVDPAQLAALLSMLGLSTPTAQPQQQVAPKQTAPADPFVPTTAGA